MPRMQPLPQDGLLYEALATQLAEAIGSGRVKPGERLPSVRTLSERYKVSISTAVQAYRFLENRRLIEARPKSGFYAAQARAAPPEPRASRPPAAARYVVTAPIGYEYNLALGEASATPLGALVTDHTLFPTGRLARLLASVARRHPDRAGRYSPPLGEEPLRRAIARRALEYGCNLAPGDILVTNGCVEALNLALRAVARAGDTIALESPTYFAMLQMIESLGMKALEVPTHPRTGLSLEALDLATQRRGAVKALMVTPSFTNPLGSVMPEAARQALAALCEARGVAVIEDDIYGDCRFAGPRPLPIKAWDRTGNVLLCSSFSKTLSPGYRVGWVEAGRWRDAVEALKRIGTIFTASLPQLAIAEFLESGGFDHQLRRLRRELQDRAARLVSLVVESFPQGTRLAAPDGGYVLWVELPPRVDTVELFRRARAEGILLAPGAVFTNTNRFRNALRLSFGLPDAPGIAHAVARVGRMAAEAA
jgi:DNA-binding transcriptional MocR family regulator